MPIDKFIAIFFCFTLNASFAFADINGTNTDCHVGVSQLELVHGCIYTQGSGPGACESWESHGPQFYAPLLRTSPNRYSIDKAEFGLNVTVIFNGKDKAQISISAPGVSQTERVSVSYENFDTAKRFPGVSSQAHFRLRRRQLAFDYDVTCSFGLSDAVAAEQAAESAAMDALGPAVEWHDGSAFSLALLPAGTVLELAQDLNVDPGSDTARTTFVEQNGLVTRAEFDALKLPYRFASAEFFNANNGYIAKAHYPKGMRLEVVQVTSHAFDNGGRSYDLTLKLLSLPSNAMAVDPITRLTVTGRRSGTGDVKVPQLAELLRPVMKLQLPN